MSILSSTEKETDSPCVPSRRVVSKVKIFIKTKGPEALAPGPLLLLLCRCYLVFRYAGFFLLLEEWHHGPQLPAHHLDALVARRLPHGQEFLPSRAVFVDPLFREFARLHLRQDLLHLGARAGIDDARTPRV